VPLTVSRYTGGAESGAKISVPVKSLTDLTAPGNSLGQSTELAGIAVARAESGWTFAATRTEAWRGRRVRRRRRWRRH
jgi:hypothetical protein